MLLVGTPSGVTALSGGLPPSCVALTVPVDKNSPKRGKGGGYRGPQEKTGGPQKRRKRANTKWGSKLLPPGQKVSPGKTGLQREHGWDPKRNFRDLHRKKGPISRTLGPENKNRNRKRKGKGRIFKWR